MSTDPVQQKLAQYRKLYKKRYKKTDKDFDKLVGSYSDPRQVVSYLRDFLNAR